MPPEAVQCPPPPQSSGGSPWLSSTVPVPTLPSGPISHSLCSWGRGRTDGINPGGQGEQARQQSQWNWVL